jgi:phosphoglycan alpha-1,2-arabinopyranosyltransferase
MQHRGVAGTKEPCCSALHFERKETGRSPPHVKRGERWWRGAASLTTLLRWNAHHRTRALLIILTIATGCFLLVLPTVLYISNLIVSADNRADYLLSLQRSLFFEDELVENVTRPGVAREGGLCVLCMEGHVLFRSPDSDTGTDVLNATADARPTHHDFTVCLESVEEERTLSATARLQQHRRPPLRPLGTPRDCVARLFHIGLLQPPRAVQTAVHNDSCVELRVVLHVVKERSATAVALTQCSTAVAQLRRSSRNSADAQLVELATPRLTVWPPTDTAPPGKDVNDDDGHEASRRHRSGMTNRTRSAVPPSFGTAAVRVTDIDRDVPAPSAIMLDDALGGIVITFAAANGAAASPDLHCPLRFLTVRLGRFGRHHNQLQEVLNVMALAHHLNRTLLLPPFVPALYTAFLKLDTEIFYGWHTLREIGRHCLLTYSEARPILRRAYAATAEAAAAAGAGAAMVMTMERVHFALDPAAQEEKDKLMSEEEKEWLVWGHLPRLPTMAGVPTSSAPVFDADEWFACGVRRTQNAPALLHPRGGETPLCFREVRPPFTHADLQRDGGANRTCWEHYRAGMRALVARYGGNSSRRGGGGGVDVDLQPDLLVISSATAFHARPRLVDMTRLLGLLRPSPYITSEIGRFYRLFAPRYRWPMYTNPLRHFDDVLQPQRFRGVVGIHVRRRELTCRREAEHLSETILSLSRGKYVLDGTGDGGERGGPAPSNSTVARLANDCVWNAQSLVHIFQQYTQWMTKERQRKGGGVNDGKATLPYTSYVAYDEQAGPIGQEMEVALQQIYHPAAKELLADGTKPSFTAIYDRRPRVDFREAYYRAKERVAVRAANQNNSMTVAEATALKTDLLIELLYPLAEQELMGVTFDFFMLSNTEVFRGNVISSVSINVCVRRWGRGLPCHGVMAGYYDALYKGFL